MTADIRTLTGSAFRTSPPVVPAPKLEGNVLVMQEAELLSKINTPLFKIEAETRRLLFLMRDPDEVAERVAEIIDRVLYPEPEHV
jgi:hypothetical protein